MVKIGYVKNVRKIQMNFNDYNGQPKERFLQFKYFFWALSFNVVLFGDLILKLKGLGWKWLGY